MVFRNMKWNSLNRKWNYFSPSRSSDQKTSLTKVSRFCPMMSSDLTLVLFPEHCEPLISNHRGSRHFMTLPPSIIGINFLNAFNQRISESLLFILCTLSSEIRSKKKTSLKSWNYHPTRSTLTRRLTWRPKM
jgi:hypothetical protein